MVSQVKGRRRVKKAVKRFCEDNNYEFVAMGSGKGKRHGRIEILANGHKIVVGWSGSPKAGWESVCLKVVDHIKRKIRDADLRTNGQ